MRRIEELIQYRAQFKIDWLSNNRGLRLRPKLTELIEKRTLNRASRSRNVIRSGLIIELELVGRSNEVYLSPGLGKKIIVSAMKRFLQFLFVAAAGLGLAGQEDPHSVDKCDILPRAGAHQCHCPKMVSDVQQEYVDRCVRESKTKDEYRECMAKMPEHCDIVAYPSRYGASEHKDQCKTTCKPERCFCNDGSCPPHQPSEEEVKSARW